MRFLDDILMDESPYMLLERNRNRIFGSVPVLQTLDIELEGCRKNIWEHTMKVCAESPAVRVVRWAALFHDIGKPMVYGASKGSIFANHAEVGAEEWLSRSVLFRNILSEEDVARIEVLIRMHMRIEQYRSEWGWKAVKKLVDSYRGDIKNGIALARADGWSYYLSDHLERRICHIK